MKTAEPKNTSVATMQKAGKPFFSKEGEGDFFGNSIKKQTNFFKPSSSLSVGGKGVLQTKLTIGQSNDKYEKEADSIADRVVQRLSTPETLTRKENGVQTKPLTAGITPVIQTKCAECENEEKLQKKEEDELQKLSLMDLRRKPIFESNAEPPEDDNTVHRKCSSCEQVEKLHMKAGSGELTATPDIENSLMSSKGSGSPLPSTVREQMESSFDADFSNVRIHTSSTAVGMNKDLHAQAFTHGNDIYFNSGRFDTNSQSGKHLLAHELTHTVQQQGGSARRKIQRWPDWVSDAAGWVSDTASDVAGTVVEGAEAVGGAVADGARWVGGKVADGAGWVVDQVSAAAQWVIDRIRSVISSGTDYLTERWESIKEFGRTAFDNIKNGFGNLVHFVTTPLSGFMSALSMMNADLLVGIWDMVKNGANALWEGINSVINGVLQIGRGIWDTVSGFINGIFGTIEGLFSNAAFDLLPDFIKSEARSIFNGLRALWNQVSTFWTDLWNDLTTKIQEILSGIRSFVDNLIGYAIDKVVSMVRGLKEVYDYVMKIFADPEAFIRPILEQLAAKLNAEAPPKAKSFGEDLSKESFPGGSPTTDNGEVQMQGEEDDADRRTATFMEVVTGLWNYIVRAWNQLDILQMLWDTVVNMFWPPATIRAIVAQFSILWNEEWAHTLDSLYTPRNFFDNPFGCLHDIWSNFLILLEFPLALWRTLNYVVGLLMGYITIIVVLVEAIIGGVLAVEVGVVPGLIAGAEAGLATVAPLGEALMTSYLLAESITVGVALTQLFTARQTCIQREKDLLTTVSSLVGMAVSFVLQFLMALLAELVSLIVQAIRGIGKGTPAPQPQPPQPTPPQPTPPQPVPPQPVPPQPVPPAPVPPAPVPPAPVPPAPVPPAPVPPAPVPPAPRPRPRPRPRPQPQPQPQLSPKFEAGGERYLLQNRSSDNKGISAFQINESSENGNNGLGIQTARLPGFRVALAGTMRAAQGGIDHDRCELDKCDLPYKWTRNNATVPGNPVLRYCGKKKNSYVKHGHHSWPKNLGGPEDQGRLLPVDLNIHLREFHGVQGPIGPIHKAVEAFLNNSRDYRTLLQGNPLTNNTTSRGNQLLINRMRTGGGNDAVLRSRVKNTMMAYYLYYRTNSKPPLPIVAYSTGLNNSVNNIR